MKYLRRIRHRLSLTPIHRVVAWRHHRHLRSSDVFLASYPRAGNTWLRSLLFEVLLGETPSFGDINGPHSPVPNLGSHRNMPGPLPGRGRLIKTHEPFRSEYRKAIYLVRDPRDVALSEYRFQRWSGVFDRDLDSFLETFVSGHANGYGSWAAHVEAWLETSLIASGDLLIVRYEDVRFKTMAQLRRIIEFLELPTDEEQIEKAIDNNSIARMRDREDRERGEHFRGRDHRFRFINEGAVEGWRTEATEAQVRRIEAHVNGVMARLGYTPAYED